MMMRYSRKRRTKRQNDGLEMDLLSTKMRKRRRKRTRRKRDVGVRNGGNTNIEDVSDAALYVFTG